MTRIAGFILALSLIGLHAQAADEQPNFVLIMCDDLGWGDVGFNGGETILTPNLDEMAENSLRFSRFYAAAPVCSPTRGSVITGRHPFRYGIYTANTGKMKRGEFTLYEALKTKGYRTGHFGKWHMGTLTTKIKDANRGKPGDTKNYSAPWHHQVDECLVTESKTPTYDPMIFPTKRGSKRLGWFPVTDADGEDVGIYGTHYFTGEDEIVPIDSPKLKGDDSKIIVDHTIPFIRDAVEKKAPFFTIVWFHAPHLPCVAGPEHTKHYPNADEFAANYYGCITALDEQVGRLRAELRELGVAENTMVAFCSDNGPEGSAKAPGSAADFRGRKRSLYEGGIRVPGLIEWPAKIKAGQSTDFPAGTVDYFPTIMAAAGFELPNDRPMDGVDLSDVFAGKTESRSAPLAFQDRSQWALNDNRYKIYSKTKGKTWELYDLLDDRGETNDLAAQKPEVVQRMAATFMQWRESCASSDTGADYD